MTNTDKQAFGNAIRTARTTAGRTLREVADVVGYTISHVSDWEQGRRGPPDYDKVQALATFLGADLRHLVEARAQWYGHMEVPLTRNARENRRASALAVRALTKGA